MLSNPPHLARQTFKRCKNLTNQQHVEQLPLLCFIRFIVIQLKRNQTKSVTNVNRLLAKRYRCLLASLDSCETLVVSTYTE